MAKSHSVKLSPEVFEVIAKGVRKFAAIDDGSSYRSEQLAELLADELESHYPSFDRARFIESCEP